MNTSEQNNQTSKFTPKKIIATILVVIACLGLGYALKVNGESMAEQAKIEATKKAEEDAKKAEAEAKAKAEADAKAKAEAEQKEKDRQIAHNKVLEILNTLPSNYDSIEERTWYKPYGYNLPARNICTWYVGKQGDRVWMRGLLGFFTENGKMISEWSINKIIFASSAGKYTVELQQGNGVIYTTTDGAKFDRQPAADWRHYYKLDCDYSTLKPGYDILASGSDPVIRYYHNQGAYDQYVNQEDVASIKTSLALYEYISALGNNL